MSKLNNKSENTVTSTYPLSLPPSGDFWRKGWGVEGTPWTGLLQGNTVVFHLKKQHLKNHHKPSENKKVKEYNTLQSITSKMAKLFQKYNKKKHFKKCNCET